jgi:hypothetical protein
VQIATHSISEALADLDRVAPGAPLLALGQTVFWDEPMKAGVALIAQGSRRLIAGVHDTDYFAKLPGGRRGDSAFQIVPHNDTTTRGLWSAAGEFSALFGSETVITQELLQHAGLRLERLERDRPRLLDEATEAWGWRGIVSLAETTPITAEVPVRDLMPELMAALDWALQETVACVSEPERIIAQERADRLRELVQTTFEAHPDANLSEFYRLLIPSLYRFVAGSEVELETAKTTDLLTFNTQTCDLARFDLPGLFLDPETAEVARQAYDSAVAGTEIYSLDRFGTGAIPFDLVIPGVGRGTLRIGRRALIVMTRQPQFVTLKKPVRSTRDLAEAIESKFGPNCVLIGKAVTLLGMLAREHVFVFHEGASGYARSSRKLHAALAQAGLGLRMNPILRVRYRVWDALAKCFTWLRLPEPLQRPFGAEEICAPSFASRWSEVAAEQRELLERIGRLRRPLDLIRFLEESASGSWKCLAREYQSLHDRLETVEQGVNELKERRRDAYGRLKALKRQRGEAEAAKGRHWRERIFEREPSEDDLRERERLSQEVERLVQAVAETHAEIRALLREQKEFVSAPEVRQVHERRRAIELEAELKRLRLIRQAVICSTGLTRASHRPSAWWFPLLCPDGGWFRHTIDTAQCWLEPLEG